MTSTESGWMGGFPAFPGAAEAGSQHVSGAAMHVVCKVFVTPSAPDEVVRFYRARFADAEREASDRLTVRKPKDFALTVAPVGASDVPRCGATIPPTTRTLIVLSQAMR